MNNHDRLVDQIYEAALVPELWTTVLEEICKISGCFGGVLFSADSNQTIRHVVTDKFRDIWGIFVKDNWNEHNIRRERLSQLNYAGFVTDLDVLTIDEIDRHPFYRDLMRPNGGGWGIGTMIPIPSGDLLVFNLERKHSDGPVDRKACGNLDLLRGHLARAGLLSLRLQMERARNTVSTLENLGLPAAVIGNSGRVLAANKLLLALHHQIAIGAFDAISILSHPSHDLLKESFVQFSNPHLPHGAKSIPIPATSESVARIAHLVPLRGAAHDIFFSAISVMVITPLRAPDALPAEVLSGLFDLTPAEARVAQGIVVGRSVEAIALEQRVTKHTIRNQLKSIFSKTGTKRQSELVGLLGTSQSFKLKY